MPKKDQAYQFFRHASPETVHKYVKKMGEKGEVIPTTLLHLIKDQSVIDEYIRKLGEKGKMARIKTLKHGSQEAIDEYVRRFGDEERGNLELNILKMASKEAVTEFLKKSINREKPTLSGVPPYKVVKLTSQDIIDEFVRNVGKAGELPELDSRMFNFKDFMSEEAFNDAVKYYFNSSYPERAENLDLAFEYLDRGILDQDTIDHVVKYAADVQAFTTIPQPVVKAASEEAQKYFDEKQDEIAARRRRGESTYREIPRDLLEELEHSLERRRLEEDEGKEEKRFEYLKHASQELIDRFVKNTTNKIGNIKSKEIKLASKEVQDRAIKTIENHVINRFAEGERINPKLYSLVSDEGLKKLFNIAFEKGVNPPPVLSVRKVPQSIIDDYVKKMGKAGKDIRPPFLINASQDVVDHAARERMKDPKNNNLTLKDLKSASQEVKDEFIRKQIKEHGEVHDVLLDIASQEVIDEYIEHKRERGEKIDPYVLHKYSKNESTNRGSLDNSLNEGANPHDYLKHASPELISKYVKKMGHKGYRVPSMLLSYVPDRDIINEYIKNMGEHHKILTVITLRKGSQEVVDEYIRKASTFDNTLLDTNVLEEGSKDARIDYFRNVIQRTPNTMRLGIDFDVLAKLTSSGFVDWYVRKIGEKKNLPTVNPDRLKESESVSKGAINAAIKEYYSDRGEVAHTLGLTAEYFELGLLDQETIDHLVVYAKNNHAFRNIPEKLVKAASEAVRESFQREEKYYRTRNKTSAQRNFREELEHSLDNSLNEGANRYEYLKHASPELISKYVKKMGSKGHTVPPLLLRSVPDQNVIDEYIKNMGEHKKLSASDSLQYGSQEAIDEYIRKASTFNVGMLDTDNLKLGSKDARIDYFKHLIETKPNRRLGMSFDMVAKLTSPEFVDWYVRKMGEKEILPTIPPFDLKISESLSKEAINDAIKEYYSDIGEVAHTLGLIDDYLEHGLLDQETIDYLVQYVIDSRAFFHAPDSLIEAASEEMQEKFKRARERRSENVHRSSSNDLLREGDGFDYLKHASQEVVDRYVAKYAKDPEVHMPTYLLKMASQEVVDDYVRWKINEDYIIPVQELWAASQDVVNEYVRRESRSDKTNIEPEELDLATQDVVDEHIRSQTKSKKPIKPTALEKGSQDVIDEYVRTIIDEGLFDKFYNYVQMVEIRQTISSDELKKKIGQYVGDDEQQEESREIVKNTLREYIGK